MIKAIAIIRTSTDKQEIESQKEQVLQMCYDDGLTDEEVVIVGEQGASAIKLDDIYMKNLNYIYELIESNKSIKCVYAWAIDRIGRVESVLHSFREFLVNKQVQLKIRNPNLVLLDYYGKEQMGVKVQFSVYATLAAIEMDNKKERFKRAKARNKKLGKFNGGPRILYGYKVDENGYFVPSEDEVEILREVFEEYATGNWSLRKLCVEVMNRGYKRYGKPLPFGTIKTMLYNGDKYCGKDTNIAYPPILSENLVKRVNEQLKKNKNIQKSSIHHYFAHKIMKCPCGETLRAYNDHYKCASKTTDVRKLTGKLVPCKYDHNNVSIPVMDGILWTVAKECHGRAMDELNNDKKKELNKEKRILERKINKFEKDLDSFKDRFHKLVERSALENLPDDMYESILQKLKLQEDNIKKENNLCKEKLDRINATLAMGRNKRRDNEIKFLTLLLMDAEPDEREMRNLVRKYITSGVIRKYEGDVLKGYEGWKTSEIILDTIFGQRRFMYFPYAKKQKNLYEYVEGKWDWFVYEDVVRDKTSCKLVLREVKLDD